MNALHGSFLSYYESSLPLLVGVMWSRETQKYFGLFLILYPKDIDLSIRLVITKTRDGTGQARDCPVPFRVLVITIRLGIEANYSPDDYIKGLGEEGG